MTKCAYIHDVLILVVLFATVTLEARTNLCTVKLLRELTWRTSIANLPNADTVTDFELCNLWSNSNDMTDNFVARNDGLTADVNHFRK